MRVQVKAESDMTQMSKMRKIGRQKDRQRKEEQKLADKRHRRELLAQKKTAEGYKQISEELLEEAREQHAANRRLVRQHWEDIDVLKVAHRDDVKRRQKVHLGQLERQKSILDKKQEVLVESH